jgi:hypothetical protein
MGKQDIEQHSPNAEKSLILTSALFPDEEWINTEKNIYVSKSRMIEKPMNSKNGNGKCLKSVFLPIGAVLSIFYRKNQ